MDIIMLAGFILCCLVLAPSSIAHPIDPSLLARPVSARSTLASASSSENAPSAATLNVTDTFDLAALLEGNQKFRERNSGFAAALAKPPGVMFIGCSDNRLGPDAIFRTQPGSTISHHNLANQFTAKDPSADAAVAFAVNDLGVQHIIVLGHYGCKSVHMAMSTQPMDRIAQTWLQPVVDLFFRSKRDEIKKVWRLRRWHDTTGAEMADGDAFRALIEENVKATVRNIQNESVLSIAYNRRNKTNKLRVFVHGLVVNEESGEVKDLGVSFGPPGQTIPKLPFEVIVEPKHHNSFGKFKPKAKKLDPTSSFTAPAETSTSPSPVVETA
ncbi:putative reversible hydration of carbon dioxide [Lyophyllum shimeji]|uniref:Carbonic anhydrase n=1 Tax=Lyophyllum shimeji TaxID=47721 RepID=A0A9P3PKZ4_LYOSH|nr:putative reversible hydration of carbon dioxide [Lyophyllum shimeji]